MDASTFSLPSYLLQRNSSQRLIDSTHQLSESDNFPRFDDASHSFSQWAPPASLDAEPKKTCRFNENHGRSLSSLGSDGKSWLEDWNRNNNGRRGTSTAYTSTGVEGKAAPMRPGEGDCSVMVAAQNLMANYIPVFNPKGAMVDMHGPPHGHLDQARYQEKVKGWSDAVKFQENGGADTQNGNRNVNNAKMEAAGDRRPGWPALAASLGMDERNSSQGGGGRKNVNKNARFSQGGAKNSPRAANGSFLGSGNNNNESGSSEMATNYNDDLGECLDWIDDEYKKARENAKQVHKSLSKIFDTIKSSLKPGPPIGSRWDAFRNAFKTGKVGECPEMKLAKELSAYKEVLIKGTPLDFAVAHISKAFGMLCANKVALEHDIKGQFLNSLWNFLDKEWKDLVTHDKAVQDLAVKIQKAKSDGRDHEAIAEMMHLFKHERNKTLYLFEYILQSDYGQIMKFIDLVQCYIDYTGQNMELLGDVMASLRLCAKAAKPDDVPHSQGQPLGPAGGLMAGCLGTCTVPCKPAPGVVTDTKADTREIELEMQRIFGAKLPQKPGNCDGESYGQTCKPDEQPAQGEAPLAAKSSCGADDGSAAFLQYMEKRIKTRPYGFVKEAYEATKPGEMTLHIGEVVYLKGKPGFDRYCGEKEDGTKGAFPQRALDVIVDIC